MNKRSLAVGRVRRVVIFSACAFLMYGGWATFAVLTSLMETVFSRMSPGVTRFLAAGMGPTTATLLLMTVVHFATGTPEIMATMLPSIVVGYAYSLIYAAGLTRRHRQLADTTIFD